MSKSLASRILALYLVVSLFVDPTTAAAFAVPSSAKPISHCEIYERQAVIPPGVNFLHSLDPIAHIWEIGKSLVAESPLRSSQFREVEAGFTSLSVDSLAHYFFPGEAMILAN